MPELPEVETVRRDLISRLLNQRINKIDIRAPKMIKPSVLFFKKNLTGKSITTLDRRGKLLVATLSGQRYWLLLHLKMTGQLIYQDKFYQIVGGHSLLNKTITKGQTLENFIGGNLPNKYTCAIINFQGGGRLFFNDLRRFGYLRLVDREELTTIIKNNYGPEPLDKEFTVAVFKKALQRHSKNIKATLLDQKIIAGLGNIYVDEVLWAARINPKRSAISLETSEINALWRSIRVILKKAIKYRGTTFSDYVDSFGRRGGFSRFLKVYGRVRQACAYCGGPIAKLKLAGRGTHYCPRCQV